MKKPIEYRRSALKRRLARGEERRGRTGLVGENAVAAGFLEAVLGRLLWSIELGAQRLQMAGDVRGPHEIVLHLLASRPCH